MKKLNWISRCLDGRRIPLNAEERAAMQGEYPYWGANSVVDYVDRWLFDEDLVLLGEDGAPFFDRSRPVAFHVNGKIWVNNHAHVLRPAPGVDPGFFAQVLNCVDYRVFIDGSTRDKLTQDDMNAIPIQLPPNTAQRAIAAFLDRETAKIDGLVAQKERLIALLQERRTALITRAVTRGLDPHAPMKDSGGEWLDEHPRHWTRLPLKRLVSTTITDGPHETPELQDDGVQFISAEAVTGGAIDFERRRGFITPELHEQYSRKCRPRRDDILICKSGATTGKLAMVDVDFEFSIWSPLAVIRSDVARVVPRFLRCILESDYVQDQIKRTWSAGTQPNIAMSDLEVLFIATPPVDEQREILEFLDGALAGFDELMKRLREGIGRLSELSSTLISAAVTGKIDVPEDVA